MVCVYGGGGGYCGGGGSNCSKGSDRKSNYRDGKGDRDEAIIVMFADIFGFTII
jgi:hypothetical protein